MTHQLTFHIRNPTLIDGGYGTIPFPKNHTSSVEFSKGPEPNTAYVLWKKNGIKEENDDGEINPTISSHKGWTMVAKCIFRGWKGHAEDWWEPNMSTLIKTDSTITDHDLNEAIKFKRQYRFRYGMRRSTNMMVNNFYWEKIIKPSEHSDLFYNEGVKNQTSLMNVLSKKNNTLKQNMGKDTSTLMMGYLGGRKKRRKKRRKTRRKRKTKKRKIKRKTKIKRKNIRKGKKTFRNQRGCKR